MELATLETSLRLVFSVLCPNNKIEYKLFSTTADSKQTHSSNTDVISFSSTSAQKYDLYPLHFIYKALTTTWFYAIYIYLKPLRPPKKTRNLKILCYKKAEQIGRERKDEIQKNGLRQSWVSLGEM